MYLVKSPFEFVYWNYEFEELIKLLCKINFEDIDFTKLPNKFVLKCTHDSGGLIICKDKSKLDIDNARKKINKCLKHSFYWRMREWPSTNVKPRIIAEEYMEDSKTGELRDYKFFCFDGVVKALLVA